MAYCTSFKSPIESNNEGFGGVLAINHGGSRILVTEKMEDKSSLVYLYDRHGRRLKIFNQWDFAHDIDFEKYWKLGTFKFGHSVAMNCDGTRILIGSTFHPHNWDDAVDHEDPSSVYLFDEHGKLLQTYRMVNPIDKEIPFGNKVDINCDGTKILVSSVGEEGWKGSVHLFSDDGTRLRSFANPVHNESEHRWVYGEDISINYAGDKILIGNYIDHNMNNKFSGSAHLFRSDGTLLKTFKIPSHEPMMGFFGKYVDFAKCNEEIVTIGGFGGHYVFYNKGGSPDWSKDISYQKIEDHRGSMVLVEKPYDTDCHAKRGFQIAANSTATLISADLEIHNKKNSRIWDEPGIHNDRVVVSGDGQFGLVTGHNVLFGDHFVNLYCLGEMAKDEMISSKEHIDHRSPMSMSAAVELGGIAFSFVALYFLFSVYKKRNPQVEREDWDNLIELKGYFVQTTL